MRTGLLSGRLCISARGGAYATDATVPAGPGLPAPVKASAQVVPVALLALYELPAGAVTFHGGAGPCLHVARVTLGGETGTYLAPGAQLVAGAGWALGPGVAFVESDVFEGSVNGPLAHLRAGGLLVSVGYRLGR